MTFRRSQRHYQVKEIQYEFAFVRRATENDCLVNEMLLIKELRPSLNTQSD